MAQGKQTMEWACKFTSFTITQGPAGSLLQQGNYEGTVSGEAAGTILGTVTFVGGKSGTFSLCVAAYLDDGNELSCKRENMQLRLSHFHPSLHRPSRPRSFLFHSSLYRVHQPLPTDHREKRTTKASIRYSHRNYSLR